MQFVSTAVLARRKCNNGLAELRVVPRFRRRTALSRLLKKSRVWL